jgi:hypothetical protein
MKTKKLVFNKKTVANLNGSAMATARGGLRTEYSCAFSDKCPTDFVDCTGERCECTFLCTRLCPLTQIDCPSDLIC